MTETKTLHSVRVRNDLWNAFLIWQTNEYHNSFQDFVEECLLEKLGLKGDIREEILKREKEIVKLRELNRASEDFLKNNSKKTETLEKARIKTLDMLLKEPYDKWTSMNKNYAMKVGKFKDRADDLERWVKNHQVNEHS